MPPGSLSTFAVINPGPRTEKSTRIWIFQRRSHFMIAVCGHFRSRCRTVRINGESRFGYRESGFRKKFAHYPSKEDLSSRPTGEPALSLPKGICICSRNYQTRLNSAAQEANNVIGRNDTDQHFVVVHHGQDQQVVFIEQLSDFNFLGLLMAGY